MSIYTTKNDKPWQHTFLNRASMVVAGAITVSVIVGPTASALDLSPLTGTVNNVLNKPINSLPVVGSPVAHTTDRLLTDTVPKTVDNLTKNLPEPINSTLDRAVETVNTPVERLTNVTQPLTDGVADTVNNLTDNLPAPVNNLLDAAETPVQSATDAVQPALNSTPNAARQLTSPQNPGNTPNLPTTPQPASPSQPQQTASRSDTGSDKSSDEEARVASTGSAAGGVSAEQPTKNKGNSSIFDPLITGWRTVIDWVASQPLVNILILAGLLVTSIAAVVYTISKDRERLKIMEREPEKKKQILLSKYTMVTASVLAVGTGLCYVALMFI